MLDLNFSFKFEDLYSSEGCTKIDGKFLEFLASHDSELLDSLNAYRSDNPGGLDESSLIVKLAPYLENFIARLFRIEDAVAEQSDLQEKLAPIFKCKRLFVQRQAARAYKPENIDDLKPAITFLELNIGNLMDELAFAEKVNEWMELKNEEALTHAKIYAGWALLDEEGKQKHKNGVLFKKPHTLVQDKLVDTNYDEILHEHSTKEFRDRYGFKLTDDGPSIENTLDHANYCIHCHKQSKDSCSKGMRDKETNNFKVNEHNITQAGCPLEEKISEMHQLKTMGSVIGAFATAVIDNPMIAGTGHRICNDCMKACIYQKQEPVNIPMAETGILKDVLKLPWGFEIYSLLTRWNPLNFNEPICRPINNKKVLVAGLGPAGYTLSHYLLNLGYTVVGIDGLKIEPLPVELSGIDQRGNRYPFEPIKNIEEVLEELDERIAYGFGGVAEYGITVRWDKNYLKILRLLLERRQNFRMYGGIRFGGTIGYEDSWKLGFDHIALALGAGRPNLLDIPNAMAKGVRTASDFLMTLQLTGAARENSLANLTVRLPVLVVGGGLTAVDTATESLAYYPVQVEKFLKNYEKLGDKIFDNLTEEETEIANEFIEHAKALRASPDKKLELLNSWGGVKVVYRKEMKNSPAYRLNHEEVELALQEGITFMENITPESIDIDKHGYCSNLRHSSGSLPAKTIFMAIGTNPNTVLNREDPKNFPLDGKFFQTVNEKAEKVIPERVSKPKNPQVILSVDEKMRAVSFFGDLHPSFLGNVVKAMGSAKQGYKKIAKVIDAKNAENEMQHSDFFRKLDNEFLATIHKIERLTPNIIEIIVKAPIAARKFEPGQFYRLQNFEVNAKGKNNYKLATEGLALTGAWVNKDEGLLSTIVLEMGASSNMCKDLDVNEPVILMGPTGTPTEIPANETVMLVGGGLGNAVLFSIGKALRNNDCKVLYFAGYKKAQDRYKTQEIEEASDTIVWACDEEKLEKTRASDYSVNGNIIKAIEEYANDSSADIKLNEVDRIITIGSDGMMAAVTYARHNILKKYFKNDHIAIGSINSPMQCMMKEICGQCIQRHYDEKTGQEHYVYSCYNQDQELDLVDFKNLKDRLCQNSLQEKVSNLMV